MVLYFSNKAEASRFSPCSTDSTGLDMIFYAGGFVLPAFIFLSKQIAYLVFLEVNCY